MSGIDGDGSTQSTWEIVKQEIVHLKWRVLVFACFLTFGSYYIYDFPGAIGTGESHTIQAKFIAAGQEYTQEMNQLLYSVYSWPNTVLAIFGGLLIDKYLGLRKAMLLFTTLVTLGGALFYIGVVAKNFPLMVFARVVFGLGGESLSVAQSAFVARWFSGGRGIALAFGITISFARVGSSFNFLFSPMIASNHDVQIAVMVGMCACIFSLFACFVLVACDIYGTKKGIVPPETTESGDTIQLSDILRLPPTLWIICVICVFSYTGIFPFIGIAKNFFQVKYDLDGDAAARWVSVYQFTCAGGSPIIGAVVDGLARNSIWMIIATGLFTLIHLLFIVASAPPGFMMAFMGFSYSILVSGLWPAVPFAVEENVVGFSYGVMTAMQNLGLAIFPIITGNILDKYPGAPAPTDAPAPGGNGTNAPNGTFAPNSTFAPTSTVPPIPTHSWAPNASHVPVSLVAQYLSMFADSDDTPAPTAAPVLPSMQGYHATSGLFMASTGFACLMSILLLIVDKASTGMLSASASRRKELKELRKEEQARLIDENKINKSGEATPSYA